MESYRSDITALNRYEGYPRQYRQKKMTFELVGKKYEGMAYLMNSGEISPPARQYYDIILQGYRENDLDESCLQTALENSIQHEIDENLNDDFQITIGGG